MRVNVYVDGFNLYHRALRNARAPDGSTYKWLDLEKLAAQVLSNPDYAIGRIRYFTARVRALPGDPQAPLRQQMYLRALATLSSVTVHFGFFQKSQKKMQLVKPLADGTTMVKVHKFEEKGSDVNLATYLLLDAFQNEYDGAAVITNDSDLAEPIRIVRDILAKRVEVLDPCGDGRTSAELARVATFYKPVRLGAICRAPQARNTISSMRCWTRRPWRRTRYFNDLEAHLRRRRHEDQVDAGPLDQGGDREGRVEVSGLIQVGNLPHLKLNNKIERLSDRLWRHPDLQRRLRALAYKVAQ